MRHVSLLCVVLLAGCGQYAAPVAPASTIAGDVAPATNCTELFTNRVQPLLGYCRSCHVPGNIADKPRGDRFMLSADLGKDYENLQASWERLGKNDNGPSLILTMPSGTSGRSHTGGTTVWPVGSDAYKDVDALLKGFDDPA